MVHQIFLNRRRDKHLLSPGIFFYVKFGYIRKLKEKFKKVFNDLLKLWYAERF